MNSTMNYIKQPEMANVNILTKNNIIKIDLMCPAQSIKIISFDRKTEMPPKSLA